LLLLVWPSKPVRVELAVTPVSVRVRVWLAVAVAPSLLRVSSVARLMVPASRVVVTVPDTRSLSIVRVELAGAAAGGAVWARAALAPNSRAVAAVAASIWIRMKISLRMVGGMHLASTSASTWRPADSFAGGKFTG
jgi:hypothetical protein